MRLCSTWSMEGDCLVQHSVCLGDGAEHSAGIAYSKYSGGDVPCYDASSADYGAVADGDSPKDGCRASYPDVVADGDGATALVVGVALLGEEGVVWGVDADVRADEGASADVDLP